LGEKEIYAVFFDEDGSPKDDFKDNKGLDSICKLLGAIEDKQDLWLIYEVCGTPLSKLLYDTKGKFYMGERIYESRLNSNVYSILEENNCE
jgi:hypothetical protein